MMKQKVIYVLSHDSIGLGEDGPTHQPIEQLASLRLTPGLEVWRPADNMETAIAWQEAIKHDGPSAIILSRQTLKPQHQSLQRANDIKKGAYVLSQTDDAPDLILISTGSELSLAMGAKAHLENDSLSVRVVSMPSVEAFLRQANSYRESVLPSSIKARVAIEASHADYWYKWVGLDGAVIGLSDFGLSAPGPMVYQSIGLTEGSIVDSAKKLLTSLSLGVNL
jgi:transketolase